MDYTYCKDEETTDEPVWQVRQYVKSLSTDLPKKDRKASAGRGKSHACGVGCCKPKCIQRCANMNAYVATLAMLILLHFVWFSYSIGIIRTVEKRFGLQSKQSGYIQSSNDILQVVLAIVIGYFGRTTHKPRFLAISACFSVIAMLGTASPYFIFGPMKYPSSNNKPGVLDLGSVSHVQNTSYLTNNGLPYQMPETQSYQNGSPHSDPGGSPTSDGGPQGHGGGPPDIRGRPGGRINYQTCDIGDGIDNENSCNEEDSKLAGSNHVVLIIFMTSSIFAGIGTCGLMTLGISYIDDNVKKGDAALYIGIVTSMFSFGPIIGFSLAAFVTRLPEDIFSEPTMSPFDPQFVGCWWLGHVIIAFPLLLVCFIMFLFPKHFREYYIHTKTEKSHSNEESISSSITGFPKAFMKIFSNLAFVSLALSKTCAMYYIVGIIINLSRYIEIHFGKPAFVANIGAAVCGAVFGAVGNISGGVLMKKLKLNEKGTSVLYILALSFIATGMVVMMFMACPQAPTAYDDHIHLTPTGYDVNQQCNVDCSCSRDRYEPVCSPDGVQYFSPCHAGCRSQVNGTIFTDCKCLEANSDYVTVESIPIGVSSEWCGKECKFFIPYMITYALISLFGSVANVPVMVLTMRLVEPELKSFALGIVSAFHNLLVFIPGPILYGALFDSACRIWRTACGRPMSCLVYDNDRYRFYMHGVSASFQVIAIIGALVLFCALNRKQRKNNLDEFKQETLQRLNSNEQTVKTDVHSNGAEPYHLSIYNEG